MERKMATIRKIDNILPIEGADLIEAIKIGGWTVVAQKSMGYKINDLVVYCEIDSFIPTEIAPFLTQAGHFPKEYKGVKGERLRTKKLKGVISQGLLLPLETLTNFPSDQWFDTSSFEGSDVSPLLGIIKWDPPAEFQSPDAKGLFPSFIPKTDQERIQNLSKDFRKWKEEGTIWEVTEKLDGSSMTVFYNEGQIGVCSRNLELKEDENNTFWKAATGNGATSVLTNKGKNIALQGELVGPGIQGNKYNLTDHVYFVYDIFDIDKQSYFLPEERQAFCKDAFLNHVPVLNHVHFTKDSTETIEDVLQSAEGKSVVGSKPEREGLVYKSYKTQDSFKAISNKWLCKFE